MTRQSRYEFVWAVSGSVVYHLIRDLNQSGFPQATTLSVDKGTRSRLLLGFLAQSFSKFCYTIIQLIQVPFLLHFWSESTYGEWLALSALPSYLMFSNLGFGSVAMHEMTMSIARDEEEAALRVFQSCWWLIVICLTVTVIVVALILNVLPIASLLNIHAISEHDARFIIFCLGLAVLLGQLEALLQAAYRSIGRNAFGMVLGAVFTTLGFTAILVPVSLGYGPRTAAMTFAATNISGTVILGIMVRRDVHWIRFGWRYASFSEIKRLAMPALAFLGLPMSMALNIQGTILVISHVLGPLAVVVFATARTVSRVTLQLVQMINITFEPEFSKTFAQKNWGLIRTLHQRACQSALILSGITVAIMIAGGPFLLNHWTQGKVPPSRPLLSILLLVVIVYSLWQTSSSILLATNQHKRLSAISLAANLANIVITWGAAKVYGLYGAAASLVIVELIMTAYVLPNTLRMTHDTLPEFLRSMIDIPASIHPRALLRRLSRSREPESTPL